MLADITVPTNGFFSNLPPPYAMIACGVLALVALMIWKQPLGKGMIIAAAAIFLTLFFVKH